MSFSSKYPDKQVDSDNFSYLKENVVFFLKRTHWFIIYATIVFFIAKNK